MDIIVKTISKALVPFIWMFGAYIIIHGHLTPGGSFSGGTIVAAGIVLLVIGYGTKNAEKVVHDDNLHVVEAIAGVILVTLLVSELFLRGYLKVLMGYFNIFSAGEIMLLNTTGGIMVLAALIMIVYVFTRR